MKKYLFFLVGLLMSINMMADGPIPLKTKGHPSETGDHRSQPQVLEVYASIYNMVLTVDATNLSEDVDVTITDEDGFPVFTGNYATTSAFDIYLTSLPTGCYTIIIETETLIYEGEFEL